jgi:hypothetical protein
MMIPGGVFLSFLPEIGEMAFGDLGFLIWIYDIRFSLDANNFVHGLLRHLLEY